MLVVRCVYVSIKSSMLCLGVLLLGYYEVHFYLRNRPSHPTRNVLGTISMSTKTKQLRNELVILTTECQLLAHKRDAEDAQRNPNQLWSLSWQKCGSDRRIHQSSSRAFCPRYSFRTSTRFQVKGSNKFHSHPLKMLRRHKRGPFCCVAPSCIHQDTEYRHRC